jgi:hypothetical protein
VTLEKYLVSSYGEVYRAETGLGFLLAGVAFFQIGLFILILAARSDPTHGRRTVQLVWVLFLIFALLQMRIGRRRAVAETGMSLVLLHHFAVRPFRRATLIVLLAAALVCFVAVGQMRAHMGEGLEGMIEYARTDLSAQDAKGIFHEIFVTSFTTKETARLLEQGNLDFRHGATYLEAFEILLPLKLHPTRPLAPSQWFVQEYDPWLASKGGAYSYTHMAEGYLNFGYAGIFLSALVTGVLVRGIVQLRRALPGSQGRLLLFAAVASGAVVYIRADFASLLKTYIVSAWLPALAAAYLLGRRSPGTSIQVHRHGVQVSAPLRSRGAR